MNSPDQQLLSENQNPDVPGSGVSWSYIRNVATRHRPVLIKANIIAVLAAGIGVPVPMMMPLLVDEVLLNQPGAIVGFIENTFPENWHGALLTVLAVMVLTIVLRLSSLLLAVWQTREFTRISKQVTFNIRRRLLDHLARVSMTEYEMVGSGAVSSRLVTDINVIDEFIGATLSKFVVSMLMIIGIAAVLLWMHWQLALFVLLMNPVVIYFTMIMGKKVKTLKKNENQAVEIFQQALTETLDNIQQIRASNREQHYLLRIREKALDVKNHSIAFGWKSDAANRLSFYIFLVGFEIFRALSMLMVLFSDLSIGGMFAVYAYLWYMMTPVQDVLGIQYSYFSANAAIGRINSLINLEQEPHYPHQENPFENKHTVSVCVDDVVFSYGNGLMVLDHVSLNIGEGEKVALVGASGGGKSTLVQVILGLYPVRSGRLSFDGVPVDRIGLDVVRENVATVLQHPSMFNDSVRNNLTLGRDISDDKLWEALEIAQLGSFIKELQEGLDTIIGRQGIRFSGGQRQRLAIARAILADPKVVILDEATSSLDTETESLLHEAMHDFLQQRTTLIIAHRLSAVKQADRVYVFDAGKIIDEGHHDELIARDGLYRDLYGNR